jgi:dinuclear metal center YbgI/SA1388 family protein
MMTTIESLCQFLDAFAPRRLAEDWDNVGLLVGRRTHEVHRVMTCLTITPQSAEEAVARGAQAIVAHHPLPFRPLKRLTPDTLPGRLLLQLIEAKIAVLSPHTCFDSAKRGINQRLAEGMGIAAPKPLEPLQDDPDGLGAGRFGDLREEATLGALAETLKQLLRIHGLHRVGPPDQVIRRAAVACGSAGTFLGPARREGCDLLVTGETTFHTCLEAEADEIAVLLPGHYASERFAVEALADEIAVAFPSLDVWASEQESDPLVWQ